MHQHFKFIIFGHDTIVKTIIKDLSRTQVSMHKGYALRNQAYWQRFDAKCPSTFWRAFLNCFYTSF